MAAAINLTLAFTIALELGSSIMSHQTGSHDH